LLVARLICRAITLVAPGKFLCSIQTAKEARHRLSFAAPHVTATVALLQEFGDFALRRTLLLRQLGIRQLNWSLASRRQEVMKAVMLNSADKVQDTGNGTVK